MDDIIPYLEADYYHRMDYHDFERNLNDEDEVILKNIERFISEQIKDILLITIEEDVMLTEEEMHKLPRNIRHYLNYSELRGIKMYVFRTNDGDFRTAIGAFGGTTLRANERYFDQIIKDERYKDITATVTMKLSELLKNT